MPEYEDNPVSLRLDAEQVARGHELPAADESVPDQLDDLETIARAFGLYDAADWLRDQRQVPDGVLPAPGEGDDV